mgnify:FL=1
MEKKKYEKYRLGSLSECLEERAVLLAQYMIEHKATVRQTAKKFGVSKSTVHKDLTEKLPAINHALASQVREVLDVNKSERHIRGGLATKEKYLLKEKEQEKFRNAY